MNSSQADANRLVDTYLSWLRDRTTLRQLRDGWIEITTPFLDRHNDFLQILLSRENGGYVLTDDGYTLRDLELTGCKIDTPKREDLLRMTLRGFGVDLIDEALQVRCSELNFPQKKHDLVQAMLAVNDLFYLTPPVIAGLFIENVAHWLDDTEIRYSQSVKLQGKSGYDHLFDFLIPKSKLRPERIIKVINRPSRNTAEAFMFSWHDTRDARPVEARAYAILNDRDHKVQSSVLEALKRYDIIPVPWSHKRDVEQELAA
jgi:hypothetical protein